MRCQRLRSALVCLLGLPFCISKLVNRNGKTLLFSRKFCQHFSCSGYFGFVRGAADGGFQFGNGLGRCVRLGQIALVVVDVHVGLQLKAVAHDLLAAGQWAPTELAELARRALGSSVRPVILKGPETPVMIAPERALTLAIVLNELAVNAAKHGAFRNPEGTASLTWCIAGDTVEVDI